MIDKDNLAMYAYNLAEDALELAKHAGGNGDEFNYEINALVNSGAKNKFLYTDVKTVKSTTATENEDGSVTYTSSGTWTQYIVKVPVVVGKKYKFYLNVKSALANTWQISLRKDNASLVVSTAASVNPRIFEFTAEAGEYTINIYVNNSASSTTNVVTAEIMVYDALLGDDTFVPYAPTNRELYKMLLSLMPSAAAMNDTE